MRLLGEMTSVDRDAIQRPSKKEKIKTSDKLATIKQEEVCNL